MRKLIVAIVILVASAACGFAGAPTDAAKPSLEFRANDAFARSDYAAAFPLLQKLALDYKNNPDKLAAVQEKLRVCATSLANTPGAVAVQGAPGAEPAVSNESRTPHAPVKDGETLTVAIKDLGNFDYDADKGGNIPDDVKALSGATVHINGFMIPMDQAESISQFALVPSLFACCFGQPPQIQHTIVVNCPKGKAVGYYPEEIIVEGKLKVEEKKEDGYVVSLFEITCSSVKPAGK